MSLENPQETIGNLSNREVEVLRLLLQGFSNQQIASELQICEKTVEKHLTSIYNKAGVSSRTEAILWGMAQGRDFPT